MPKEIFLSFDVEANGPCPGLNSMLSLGVVALDPSRMKNTVTDAEVSAFSVNFEEVEGTQAEQRTIAWWQSSDSNKQAYARTRENALPPVEAMGLFRAWVKQLPGKPTVVAYPLGFDFPFLYYYCHRFLGECPVGFSGIDMKSYAMAMLRNESYAGTAKRSFPKHWFPAKLPHTHVALEDAREQGLTFMAMYRENVLTAALERLEALRSKA